MELTIDSVRWKARFPNAGVDADKAYEAIETIRTKNGGTCSAEDVVSAAKARNNPLHKLFEWDDTAAAREYRLQQARAVLRAIEVVYKERPEEPTRAFEVVVRERKSDKPSEARTLWSSHEQAVSDPKSREALIAEAIQSLMSWRRRFKMLDEFDRLLSAIDETLDEFANSEGA